MSQNQHWTVTLPSLFFRSVPCTRATVVYSGPSKARKSWNRAFSTHGWIDDINSSSWHFKREKKNGKRKTANAYTHTSPFCPMSRNGSVRPFCVCVCGNYIIVIWESWKKKLRRRKNNIKNLIDIRFVSGCVRMSSRPPALGGGSRTGITITFGQEFSVFRAAAVAAVQFLTSSPSLSLSLSELCVWERAATFKPPSWSNWTMSQERDSQLRKRRKKGHGRWRTDAGTYGLPP
jgi:hypothetical protein